ncbi:MAG: phosphatidate cytidylyltransferase [Clostridiales bacterium]|nr:phosphatidate cytidylyltransferase [Clostridiales bacterium]
MSDLLKRSIVAVVLLGVLALMLIFGGWIQVAVFTFAAVVSVIEMDRMFRNKGIRILTPPLFIQAGLQTVLLMLISEYGFPKFSLPALFIIVFLYIVTERILNGKRTTEDFIATLFVMVYPLLLIMCFGLFGFNRWDVSRMALFMVFAGPSMADNNAYLFGSKFGKHKLCPSISPHKTVEGYIAGLIGGPIGGLIVYFMQKLWGFDIHWAWLVGLGLIGAVIGQFGDLLASTFKRWSGIKDFGRIFPGHGGVIDRLDSAMVFAPFVAFIFWYFIR